MDCSTNGWNPQFEEVDSATFVWIPSIGSAVKGFKQSYEELQAVVQQSAVCPSGS